MNAQPIVSRLIAQANAATTKEATISKLLLAFGVTTPSLSMPVIFDTRHVKLWETCVKRTSKVDLSEQLLAAIQLFIREARRRRINPFVVVGTKVDLNLLSSTLLDAEVQDQAASISSFLKKSGILIYAKTKQTSVQVSLDRKTLIYNVVCTPIRLSVIDTVTMLKHTFFRYTNLPKQLQVSKVKTKQVLATLSVADWLAVSAFNDLKVYARTSSTDLLLRFTMPIQKDHTQQLRKLITLWKTVKIQ